MMALLPRRISSRRAATILRRIFGAIPTGFAFRLWDGTAVPLGAGAPVCTVVVHSPETFIELMRDPTPYRFAEAYVDGALDLEGDLFAAMTIADAMETLDFSLPTRLRLLVDLWRS
jgi:cyclopropane-fatty-acyl-phospholipid synthase